MYDVKRPGVDAKWAKSWMGVQKTLRVSLDQADKNNRLELQHYAEHGVAKAPKMQPPAVHPPFQTWEIQLGSALELFAYMRIAELELDGISGQFNRTAAASAFSAECANQFIRIHSHAQYPRRFGRPLQTLDPRHIAFTALGVVLGCEVQAFRLARLQLFALRKKFYLRINYPIFQFVLRILADYLEEPPLVLEGEALEDPIFNALFAEWRNPDLDTLLTLCLAACDFHTSRCKPDGPGRYYEFDNVRWTHIPIEILLLFRLRELLGLENPEVDHPLMKTVLGQLPCVGDCEPDDLIKQVRARLEAQGYNEERILQELLSDGD